MMTLIVSAGDRDDVMLATALAASNGVQLAGLLLTHGSTINPRTDLDVAASVDVTAEFTQNHILFFPLYY